MSDHDEQPQNELPDEGVQRVTPLGDTVQRVTLTADDVPRWPKAIARLEPDGTGTLSINGAIEELEEGSLAAARQYVIDCVSEMARDVKRAVRLDSDDPDGEWELAVDIAGDVHELAPGRPKTTAASTEPPAAIADPRLGPPWRDRRRPLAVGAAVLSLLLVIGLAAALLAGSSGNNHGPQPSTARQVTSATTQLAPTTSQQSPADKQQAAKQLTEQRKRDAAAAAKRKKAKAAEHRAMLRRVNHRMAVKKRAARARATPTQAAPTVSVQSTPQAPAQTYTQPAASTPSQTAPSTQSSRSPSPQSSSTKPKPSGCQVAFC